MKFKEFGSKWLHALEEDDTHLYRAITPKSMKLLKQLRSHPFLIPITDTEYKLTVDFQGKTYENCDVLRVPKLPFQIRIQETTRTRARDAIVQVIDFIIDCMKLDIVPLDTHESNILFWKRLYFVDLDAFFQKEGWCMDMFARITYLYYKYVLGKKISDHASFGFAVISTHGGWAAKQLSRNFEDLSVWREFRQVVADTQIDVPETHWLKAYAYDLQKTNENQKMVATLDILKDVNERTMIDIGCNKGYLCNLLSDKFDSIVGFDNDEACIDVAMTRAAQNVEFCHFGLLHLTEDKLPAIDRFKADLVIALAVTHHFNDAGMDVHTIADIFDKLTKKWLLIEDIVNVEKYHAIFKEKGLKLAKRIDSYPEDRKLALWRRD